MRILLLSIIILTAVVFISCNSSNSNIANPKPLEVASATSAVKYQCPMKCEGDTAYTTEGQCPVCEMDLEKVTK